VVALLAAASSARRRETATDDTPPLDALPGCDPAVRAWVSKGFENEVPRPEPDQSRGRRLTRVSNGTSPVDCYYDEVLPLTTDRRLLKRLQPSP
jgi:hypothetical protein